MAGKPKPQTKERFLSHVRLLDKKSLNRCWEWTGTVLSSGYGQIWWGGAPQQAHRVSYSLFIGGMREGKQLDHLCRNRKCVNPQHLEPVTARQNILRGVSQAAENAKKKKCINDHALFGKNLYITPDGRRQCKTCGKNREKKYRLSTAMTL